METQDVSVAHFEHDQLPNTSHDDCDDMCSPFCICACCGSISQVEKVPVLAQPLSPEPAKRKVFTYHSSASRCHAAVLLRPPIC